MESPGPAQEVVLPLGLHVVDAIERDDGLDVGRNRGVGIVAIQAGELGLVSGDAHQRHQLGTGGRPQQPDARGIDAEVGGLGADELDRRLHVVGRGGIALHPRLRQPVADRIDRVAVAGEVRAEILEGVGASALPAAAMDRDDRRRLVEPFGSVEIPGQLDAVVLDILHIGPGDDPIALRRRPIGRHERQGQRQRHRRHRQGRRAPAAKRLSSFDPPTADFLVRPT